MNAAKLPTLSQLASAGFTDLSGAQRLYGELVSTLPGINRLVTTELVIPDSDRALQAIVLLQTHLQSFPGLLTDPNAAEKLFLILGTSTGFTDFLARNPDELSLFVNNRQLGEKPDAAQFISRLEESIHVAENLQGAPFSDAPSAVQQRSRTRRSVQQLRVRYRRILLEITLWDLLHSDPLSVLPEVLKLLSHLADSVIHVALELAYSQLGISDPVPFSVIAMGKLGGVELNYLSDVDLIFVATDGGVDEGTAVARRLIQILSEPGIEPELWPVDTNLRPEGRDGALVRTLDSHLQYYDRWAESWEFQALLKSRPIAGDMGLGQDYRAGVEQKIWASAARPNFVESVQTMRKRVTENLSPEHLEREIKLGPGGIRDIEFTVQLLQLVHGQFDELVRQRDTLSALNALSKNGYIGRVEQHEFSELYALLRLLEHRVQLNRLTRNHLMPESEQELRILARSSRQAKTAEEISLLWTQTKNSVKLLHEKLFYRPLLNAVAGLEEVDIRLTDEAAIARLSAIGFQDSASALKHISAMATGVSRRAQIQRHLLPAILRWLSEGIDPDYGLLAFRRISDELGGTHWYLRMLRDSSGAAKRLSHLLSMSRFIGDLLGHIPEATAWLESNDELVPKTAQQLQTELIPISTAGDSQAQLNRIIMVRRREVLRTAMAWALGRVSVLELGRALSDITTAYISALAENARQEYLGDIDVAIVAMGRFGSAEQSLTSDADVIFVYDSDSADAAGRVEKFVQVLRQNSVDFILPFELDTDLRPEGKHGIQAKSVDALASYYLDQAETWEAQALLRASPILGSVALIDRVQKIIDRVRYPDSFGVAQVMEVRRIKARVEAERLPKGADPQLHFKLGRGSLSDIEWLVQLAQLKYAHAYPELKTVHTLDALKQLQPILGMSASECELLADTWLFVSRLRSVKALVFGKNNDVLPTDFIELDMLAHAMGEHSADGSGLQDKYLRMTRKSRRVFEKYFYQ